ncbi:non-canonical purine NTP pyrophosphatase [Candidatus Woesearchaeota archaeon]|nr:non-canonical purine NTP pyrophosphatase [Candidatus Woesearchaeota archaeon]
MDVHLITHNKNKVAEFRNYLEPAIKIIHVDIDYPEIRAETNETVAKHAAQALAEQLQKPVVVEDSGFYIHAWDGFPGVYTATVCKKLGNRGLLKLMQGVEDRTVSYRCAIAYCEPDGIPHVFLGEEEGTMADEERGTLGWGQDPIFVPKENNTQNRTYGEMREPGHNLFRGRALERLKEYLLTKSSQ